MNITTDLLNICQNTIKTNSPRANNTTSSSFNYNFADLLTNNSKVNKSNSYSSNSNDTAQKIQYVAIYNINQDSFTKAGLNLISKLDKFLSNNKDIRATLKTLKDIHSILNKVNNNDCSPNKELIDLTENEDTLNITSIEIENLDDTIAQTIQAILALLNQQQYTQNSVDLSGNNSFEEGFNIDPFSISIDLSEDISSENSTDELFDKISSIEHKVIDILTTNTNIDNAEVADDFMQKLMALTVSEDDISNKMDFIKKEEMLEISNNLDISSIFATNVSSIDMVDNLTDKNLHPIAKQILSTIQTQISSVDLDNKTVKLRLKLFPSKLGSISVILEHSDEGLKVTLLSDNSEVRSILSESISELESQLNKFNLNEVLVDVSANQENNDKEQNSTHFGDIQNLDDYMEESFSRIDSDINLVNKILDIKI